LRYSSLASPESVERSPNENERSIFSSLCCIVTFCMLEAFAEASACNQVLCDGPQSCLLSIWMFPAVYFQVLLGLYQNSCHSWPTLCAGQQRSRSLSLRLWSMVKSVADTRNPLHSITWSTQAFSSVQTWCKAYCESTCGAIYSVILPQQKPRSCSIVIGPVYLFFEHEVHKDVQTACQVEELWL
jgi:hypothetical protein